MAVDARHGAGERRARDALDASDDKRSGREDGAGGARREERVCLAGAHGTAAPHDGGVLLAAHGLGGVLAHLDALGGHESLGTSVLGAKGNDDLLVAGDNDLEVGIRLERPGDALEHDLWRLVSAHGVNHNANHMRLPFAGTCASGKTVQ